MALEFRRRPFMSKSPLSLPAEEGRIPFKLFVRSQCSSTPTLPPTRIKRAITTTGFCLRGTPSIPRRVCWSRGIGFAVC